MYARIHTHTYAHTQNAVYSFATSSLSLYPICPPVSLFLSALASKSTLHACGPVSSIDLYESCLPPLPCPMVDVSSLPLAYHLDNPTTRMSCTCRLELSVNKLARHFVLTYPSLPFALSLSFSLPLSCSFHRIDTVICTRCTRQAYSYAT